MEANKENYNKLKCESRIPVPVDPLPALPKHLTLEYRKKNEERQRAPLKTINSHEGPSTSIRRSRKTSTPLKVDTRFVTKRTKGDDRLDWKLKVFNDENLIIISSDEDEANTGMYLYQNESLHVHPGTSSKTRVKLSVLPAKPDKPISHIVRVLDRNTKENKNNLEPKAENPFLDRNSKSVENNLETNIVHPQDKNAKPVTPVKDTLEHSRVRNIKRSLKRPHSKELQGLSPGRKGRRSDDGPPTKRVVRGSVDDRCKSLNPLEKLYSTQLTRAYTTGLFSYLINGEKRPWTKEVGIPSDTRACVLNWLMKVNGPNGDPAILQTACWYLDATLAHQEVRIEKLQLVATACYWVAQKLYLPGVPASRLVRCSNNAFTAGTLMAAEMDLLKTLNFPPQPIIPDNFITFLSAWCDPDDPGELEVAATFLCVSGMLVHPDTSLEYPSTVAAAAVRNAVLLIRDRSVMVKLWSCSVYKLAEAKSRNFQVLMSAQRFAACKVADTRYEYKVPFQQFGSPPMYIAQKVVKAANSLAVMDSINLLN